MFDVLSIDPRLRPTHCARCEYDLTGLPTDAGACPECGRRYDGPEVCVHGYMAGSKATAWNRKPQRGWQVVWQWVWSAAFLGFFTAMWSSSHGAFHPPYGCMAIVGVGLVGSTWRWFRIVEAPPGTVLLRITPAGVSWFTRAMGPIPFARIDTGKPIPWRKLRRIVIQPDRDGLVRITMGNDADWWQLRIDQVDVFVRCPPEAVPALRAQVAAWRTAGR